MIFSTGLSLYRFVSMIELAQKSQKCGHPAARLHRQPLYRSGSSSSKRGIGACARSNSSSGAARYTGSRRPPAQVLQQPGPERLRLPDDHRVRVAHRLGGERRHVQPPHDDGIPIPRNRSATR